jgi:hypothetical protein
MGTEGPEGWDRVERGRETIKNLKREETTMNHNNVTTMQNRRPFEPSFGRHDKGNFENTALLLGTIASLVVPPAVCLAYGEIVPFITFIGIVFFGWAGGNALYRYNRKASGLLQLNLRTIPNTPQQEADDDDDDMKKAA